MHFAFPNFFRFAPETSLNRDDITLSNYDFSRIGGAERYNLKDLINGRLPKTSGTGAPLIVSSNIEYFLLLGGLTNIFMGDDCVPSEKINNVVSGLNRKGLESCFYGYCPHNSPSRNLKKNLKGSDYSFSKSVSVLAFYDYLEKKEK